MTDRQEKPLVLVVEDDLFFSVRIETTLKKQGYDVEVVRSGEEVAARAAERKPVLGIVNFGGKGYAPGDVVRQLKALPDAPPILGFVSHKWLPQVRPNAMAAGCDLLVANSAIAMRLPHLAARLAPLNGAQADLTEAAQIAQTDEEEASSGPKDPDCGRQAP